MQTLHIHGVPDNLCERLQALAQENEWSLSTQVVLMLEQAMIEEERHGEETGESCVAQQQRFMPVSDGSDSVDLVHPDREP